MLNRVVDSPGLALHAFPNLPVLEGLFVYILSPFIRLRLLAVVVSRFLPDAAAPDKAARIRAAVDSFMMIMGRRGNKLYLPS